MSIKLCYFSRKFFESLLTGREWKEIPIGEEMAASANEGWYLACAANQMTVIGGCLMENGKYLSISKCQEYIVIRLNMFLHIAIG